MSVFASEGPNGSLSPDSHRVALVLVIPVGAPVVRCVLDHVQHELLALSRRQVQSEAVAQVRENTVLALEARKVDARQHRHLNEGDDFLCVLPQLHEALDHKALEFGESARVLPTKQLDILRRHLETVGFTIDVARRVAQQKAEVYVDHVALRVEQDVPVVPVLNLQDVAEK